MRIEERVCSGVLIIEPKGRLTIENEGQFVTAVRRALDAGRTRLVLSLAEVPAIDSSGLGSIAHAYTSAWRRGGDLKLLNVGKRNLQLLTVTKLITVFEIFDSEADAILSFDRVPAVVTLH